MRLRTLTIPPTIVIALAATAVTAPASPPANGPFLKRVNPQQWTLHIEVHVTSYPVSLNQGGSRVRYATRFGVQRAAVVYPLLEGSASHTTDLKRLTSELAFDDIVYDTTPTMLTGYPAGEQMGRWDLPEAEGAQLRLTLDLPMRCASTIFDEQRAMQVGWPGADHVWPDEIASALTSELFIESDDPDIVSLVRRWTKNNPRKVKPAMLAKFLTARVIEFYQPSGEGNKFDRYGKFAGMDVKGASHAARRRRGSPFDMPALLCAVYRAAGLPARVVIGYDAATSEGDAAGIVNFEPVCVPDAGGQPSAITALHAWVEFYLYDPASDTGQWIPVDVLRQREVSSRPPALDRRWTFFGDNPCLNNILPISFHYHPPTTVVSAGAAALWGWLPTPELPVVEQWLLFRAMHTPRRSDESTR